MRYLVEKYTRYFKVIRKPDNSLRVTYHAVFESNKDCIYSDYELVQWTSVFGQAILSQIEDLRREKSVRAEFLPNLWYVFLLPNNKKNVEAIIVPKYRVEEID